MKWRSNWFEQHNYFAILSCYLLQVRVSFINDAFALSVANNFIETVECRLDANSVHDFSINLSALENPKHFSSGYDHGPDGSFSQLILHFQRIIGSILHSLPSLPPFSMLFHLFLSLPPILVNIVRKLPRFHVKSISLSKPAFLFIDLVVLVNFLMEKCIRSLGFIDTSINFLSKP